MSDLAASAAAAASLGADAISNSYGLNEFGGMQAFYADYHPATAAVVASSGDFGFTAARFPAVAPGVTAVGGTSAASPLIAGVIGLAGGGATFHTGRLYRNPADLNDVTSGSNGYCGGDYLCNAKKGYDGPTGMGTPDGIGAF